MRHKIKAKHQIKHCSRRLLERFDIKLDDGLRKRIVQDIQNGRAEFVERQSKRVTVYDFQIQDKKVRVVYDKFRKTIVTALYPEREIK